MEENNKLVSRYNSALADVIRPSFCPTVGRNTSVCNACLIFFIGPSERTADTAYTPVPWSTDLLGSRRYRNRFQSKVGFQKTFSFRNSLAFVELN